MADTSVLVFQARLLALHFSNVEMEVLMFYVTFRLGLSNAIDLGYHPPVPASPSASTPFNAYYIYNSA